MTAYKVPAFQPKCWIYEAAEHVSVHLPVYDEVGEH